MDRVKLNEALDLSRLVYGMWRLGDDADTSVDHIRKPRSSACLDQGITTMDQADIYGGYEAEEILGTCTHTRVAQPDRNRHQMRYRGAGGPLCGCEGQTLRHQPRAYHVLGGSLAAADEGRRISTFC